MFEATMEFVNALKIILFIAGDIFLGYILFQLIKQELRALRKVSDYTRD